MGLAIYIYLILSASALSVLGNYFQHPLDPLTSNEIEDTAAIIRAAKPSIQSEGDWIFQTITLKEPEKRLLLPFFLNGTKSDPVPRKSFTVLVKKRLNLVYEIVVNLNIRKVESWKDMPSGTQTTFSSDEQMVECEVIAKEDPGVQHRCLEMGWHNMSLVVGSCWGIANREIHPALANAIRPMQVYFYGKMFELDNHFAHPFGFVAFVDLAPRKVISIENLPIHSDYDANNRVGDVCPRQSANYNPSLIPINQFRTDVHPIHFTQPEGAGYQIKGNEVTWQKFNFRVGFNMREGLTIHHVSFQDGKNRRPLFYRMSVGDLFVPYADPRPPFHQKQAYDESEFNLGLWGVDLQEAGVCRGGAVSYLSYYLNNEQGEPLYMPNVICIHEEDTGLLWAHQTSSGPVVHTRSLRLTVTIFVNEGNYDYKFSWRLYQDATIEFNTELHGIVSTHLLAVNVTDGGGFGTTLSPQINGQYHQHHLSLRLDTEIDGNTNTVSTVDIVPLPDPSGSAKNPYGNGFTTIETVLNTTSHARTNTSPSTGRSWLIRNPKKIHPYTRKPVSWKLTPFYGPPVLIKEDSPLRKRSAYLDYNIWVTKYEEDQLYPGGYYENGAGLPEWIDKDPNVDVTNTDVVLWYNYGFTHIPRTEDWPIMPVESTGFFLRPTNFFPENPGLDVPPPSE